MGSAVLGHQLRRPLERRVARDGEKRRDGAVASCAQVDVATRRRDDVEVGDEPPELDSLVVFATVVEDGVGSRANS